MKSLHVAPLSVYQKHMLNFTHSQALHLSNGNAVIIGDIHPTHLDAFEKDGAVTLPFALSNEVVGPETAKVLAEHGVQSSHRTMDVLLLIAKAHRGFHPTAL